HSAVSEVLALIADMTAKIKSYDSTIAAMIKSHPAAQLVGKITGVGPLTSLAYVLTIEDPHRIVRSRSAGAYFGLVPGSDDSGEKHEQRRITKEGDQFCRRLLVNAAQYILGPLTRRRRRSEEHTSELQSRSDLVCRLLLEKKKK